MKPHGALFELVLIVLGIASVLGLLLMLLALILDNLHQHLGRAPKAADVPGWAKVAGVAMALWPGAFVLAFPDFSPVFFAALLILCLVYRRVPRGGDFWGRPTHVRWEVRFTLAQLLGIVVILGALMGWFFYLKQNVWRRQRSELRWPYTYRATTRNRPTPAADIPAGTRPIARS